jgi:hypothetical protein
MSDAGSAAVTSGRTETFRVSREPSLVAWKAFGFAGSISVRQDLLPRFLEGFRLRGRAFRVLRKTSG